MSFGLLGPDGGDDAAIGDFAAGTISRLIFMKQRVLFLVHFSKQSYANKYLLLT